MKSQTYLKDIQTTDHLKKIESNLSIDADKSTNIYVREKKRKIQSGTTPHL